MRLLRRLLRAVAACLCLFLLPISVFYGFDRFLHEAYGNALAAAVIFFLAMGGLMVTSSIDNREQSQAGEKTKIF